jgi:hypothetical protein
MMQFLACILLFFTVLNSAFGASGEKFIKNTLKQQEKNEKRCKSLHPKSVNSISKITSSNAEESVKYFDCTIDYATLLIISNPRTLKEEEVNVNLNNKISSYQEMIFRIKAKGKNSDMAILNSVEETITEKQFIIKKSDDEIISMPEKIETLEQAKRKCEKKGFKEKSFDSLELYLFEKCIKEEGFDYKRPASIQKALKVQQDEKKKEKIAQKLQEKQNKDEIKRNKELQKKKNVLEILEEKNETTVAKPGPVQAKEVKTESEIILKPAQPEAMQRLAEPEINIVPEEKIVVKTEVKPSEINKNVTYTRKTTCKIDANGSKICTYDPTYKIQGTKPINKL